MSCLWTPRDRPGRVVVGSIVGLLLAALALMSTVVVAPLSLAAAAPARDAAYSVVVGSTVLYPGCQQYDVTYSTSTPAATSQWSLEIRDADGSLLGSAASTGAGGIAVFSLCDDESTDEYYVGGTLEQCDATAVCATTAIGYTFTLRRAHSKVTLDASTTRPRFGAVVTFTMGCKIESKQGYSGIAGVTIYLQTRVGDRWRRIDSSRALTNTRGQARRSYRWNVRGPVRLRAVCAVRDTAIGHREKASGSLTVRTR